MAPLNKYYRGSHLSEARFRQLLRCFALDLTAADTARMTGLSRKTVTGIYLKIRERLAEDCERAKPFAEGHIEVDESYFGRRRVPGKRGRGASGKTPVFGILKRGGRVYTEIVPDCKKATLQAIIRGRVSPEVILHSDSWSAYDGLVDVGYAKHFRVHHSRDEFVRGSNHINGIEAFWSYAKGRLAQFRGIRREKFYLHLKECEWRFNHRQADTYRALLKLLREHPL